MDQLVPSDPLDITNVPNGASRAHIITLRLKQWLDADLRATVATNSDFSVPEWRILAVLSKAAGPLSQKDLIKNVKIAQGQASRALFSMQERGLLKATQSSTDRRAWTYEMTRTGRTLFTDLLPHMSKRADAIDSAVSEKELAAFERIAIKIAREAEMRLA